MWPPAEFYITPAREAWPKLPCAIRCAATGMVTPPQDIQRAQELAGQGQFEQAATAFRALLKADPDNAAAHRGLGLLSIQMGDAQTAIDHLTACHRLAPKDAELQFNLGNILMATGQADPAVEHYQSAAKLEPNIPEIFANMGAALRQAGRDQEARRALRKALVQRPDFAEAHNTLGNLFVSSNEPAKAAEHFGKALASKPELIGARVNFGFALIQLGRAAEARAAFEHAITADPGFAPAYNGLGLLLQSNNRHGEALDVFERAIKADPTYIEARNNLAISYQAMGRHDDALAAMRDIVAGHPDSPAVQLNLGHILQALGRHEEAIDAYEAALRIDDTLDGVIPFLAHSLLYLCRWQDLGRVEKRLMASVSKGAATVPPFALAGTPASPALRLKAARRSAEHHAGNVAALKDSVTFKTPDPADRLRVGYVSPDFRTHSVAAAFRGLFEARDRTGFEWFGYSLNSPEGDDTAAGFEVEFDSFADISQLSALEAAQRINDDGIHVLVDLAGHTRDSRLEIFALEPAPVQVHYLGYGSTVGANYIPWLMTDPVHTPPELAKHCSEALVHLPDTFMAATPVDISDAPVTRSGCGLPEAGFVFANFNAHYKFRPETFDVWMRLLSDVDGSVLWVRDGMPGAVKNLQTEAEQRGVDPARLVFAPRVERAEHLARHRLADLSLDTQYHTGGVTTLDSLWAGVPVVSISGAAHSERTGASILNAIGFPELAVGDIEVYEAVARDLARNPDALATLRERLAKNLKTAPLFDVKRLARHVETAYRLMWESFSAGNSPKSIHVPRED